LYIKINSPDRNLGNGFMIYSPTKRKKKIFYYFYLSIITKNATMNWSTVEPVYCRDRGFHIDLDRILIKRGSSNNSPFAPFVTFASRGVHHVGIAATHNHNCSHNQNHNTMASKRSTNANMTDEVRIALCELKKKHPSLTQADLITWLQETLLYSQFHRLSCWVRSCLCSDSGGNCAGPLHQSYAGRWSGGRRQSRIRSREGNWSAVVCKFAVAVLDAARHRRPWDACWHPDNRGQDQHYEV